MTQPAFLGILIAFTAVIAAIFLEGASFRSFFHLPAFLLIVGGTMGATFASYSADQLFEAWRNLKFSFQKNSNVDMQAVFFRYWEKARREGLLSLEEEAKRLNEPFLKKGIQLIVDGSDPKTLEEILWEAHEEITLAELKSAKVLETAAGFSPTVGIIGTVLGLVTVLENLEGGTRVLGQGIATAFIATFYGIGFANLVLLPLANQLKTWSAKQARKRLVIFRGVLALQSGENRRLLSERIEPYLK